MGFNGLGMSLGNLSRLSSAKTRSISAENPTGAPGGGARSTDGPAAHSARDLGPGWKISPFVRIEGGATFTMADILGMGAIQQIWLTPTGNWRNSILRIYWDDQENPSVECPVGDFSGWDGGVMLTRIVACVRKSQPPSIAIGDALQESLSDHDDQYRARDDGCTTRSIIP